MARKKKKPKTSITTVWPSPYWKEREGEKARLYKGDCLLLLQQLPEASFDMVFADPPYFLSNGGITCQNGRMVSVDKGKWDTAAGLEEMHQFNTEWLTACRRVMKRDATIWVSGTSHNIHSIGFAMQQLGFKILNNIVWGKRNPPPNLACRYFTHSTELLVWAAPHKKSKHRFNYALMKKVNGGRQMKNVWDIGWEDKNGSSGYIEVNAPGKSEKLHGKHPTQKPLKLLQRILLASTEKGDLILDPFCGSATTGVAALGLGRRFVGIDADAEFLKLSRKRLSAELTAIRDSLLQHRAGRSRADRSVSRRKRA